MAREKGKRGGSDASRPERDSRDARIKELGRENDRLKRENDRLERENDHLKQQLEASRRAGRRQAAPFAKDRPQGHGKRPGRRPGAQYGRHGCRLRPARVDETHAAPVPSACPDCGGAVEVARVASVVTPDETGWRVGADRHWLWAYATLDTTVYAICRGRGFDDAATVLGTDYAGVLVRDGWAPYRCFRDAEHQSCLAHLLRRCKELQEDHPDSRWAGDVQATLQAGLDLRDRCNAGELSEHGMATARGRLIARLGRLVDAPPPLKDAVRFANHLVTEFLAVFLFLWDPSLDATNWRAEQAIRPAVVIRKVCGGNRTRRGADTQQVLSSVVRTARQRDLGLPPLIATILRATEPAVPAALIAGRAAAGAVEEMCATEPIGPEVLGLPPPPA